MFASRGGTVGTTRLRLCPLPYSFDPRPRYWKFSTSMMSLW